MQMVSIQFSANNPEDYIQRFIFFTEDTWNNRNSFIKVPAPHFSAKKDEVFVDFSDERISYLIGLGKSGNPSDFQNFAAKFSHTFRNKFGIGKTVLETGEFSETELQNIILGLYLGTYSYPFSADHAFFNDNFELFVPGLDLQVLNKIRQKTSALCNGQFACMEWLNKPQNAKQIPQITTYIKEIAKIYNFKISIFNRAECEKLGLGAFLSVNQGSAQEAAFTVLEYKGGNSASKTVGLVGKCVLFDTGGISIKGSENLHYMKSDMGGATAVIGTMISAAELSLPVTIVAVLPITDNAVSNSSYLPSDVVTAYNGKTIEILNTDAEGRLTLADGLSYLVENFKTDAVIDLATLTGSAVRMFGNTCAPYFSNNENLQKSIESAAARTSQRVWNLPIWDVWREELQSDVADLKNISSKPYGDCIVAAKFLEQFIGAHPAWAHFDIAGVAFGNVQYMKDKGATGYGVQLLVDFLENF